MGNGINKASDAIWRKIEDEVVVIKDDGTATHVLNKTAAYLWELCDGSVNEEGLADSLCGRFDVAREQALLDVREIIDKMMAAGIITRNGATAGSD